jgi:hypothetical protein
LLKQITAYLAGHEHGLKHVEIAKATDPTEKLPAHTLHVIVSGAAAGMENCWDPNHISDMAEHVKIWYGGYRLIITGRGYYCGREASLP